MLAPGDQYSCSARMNDFFVFSYFQGNVWELRHILNAHSTKKTASIFGVVTKLSIRTASTSLKNNFHYDCVLTKR